MPVLDISRKIGDALATLFRGTGDVLSSTIDVTRDATARTLRGVRNSRTEASRVANQGVIAAIKAGFEAGAEIGSVTKGAVIGVIQGVGQVTRITPAILSDATRAAVRETREMGGDVTTAARKAVEGAIESGKHAGMKAEDAASAAATGAIAAAADLGDTAVASVAKALSGTISGVRMIFELPSKKYTVLVVNSDRRDSELLGQQLNKEGFKIILAVSGKELEKAIKTTDGRIALALVDISDFGNEIWDFCEALRKAGIPILVLSRKRSSVVQRESVKHGASGVLTKPLGVKELIEHMRCLLGN